MNLERLEKIVDLCKEEIRNKDKNTYVTMNIDDVIVLDLLIKEYKYLKLKEKNR